MLSKYTEFPELAQRLAGVELRNPYEGGKVIDLAAFWVMDVRTSANGRLSCDILYPPDVKGAGCRFFDETVQIWFHFLPNVAVTFPERSTTMKDFNPQTVASNADAKPAKKAEKVLLHGPQGSISKGWAKDSAGRSERYATVHRKDPKGSSGAPAN